MRRDLAYPALLALLLTVALTGCRREPMPENPIRFSTASLASYSMSTKAATPPEDYLAADGATIQVWGSLSLEENVWSNVFDTQPKSVTYNATEGSWNYAVTQYWDKRAIYKFRAVHAPVAGDIQDESTTDNLVVHYKMENGTSRSDYDLMVASFSVDSAPPADNKVVLSFQHACAAVQFRFSDESLPDADAEPNYYIKRFELQNLFTEGVFSYDASGSNWDISNSSHISSVYQWTGKWGVKKSYLPIPGRDWFFVVPQDLLGTGERVQTAVHFTFVHRVNGKDGPEIPVTFNLGTYHGDSVIWEHGKMYSYIIALQPEESSISFSVQDWERSYVAVDDLIF